MIQFPNGKINLGLSIVGKRPDGYHDLETVFYPVAIHDALEFIESREMKFTSSGLTIAGNLEDNLIWKAYHLLKKDFPAIPPVNIHLLKKIPMGAGLGGGSADAAFMLTMLNAFANLGLQTKQLLEYAAQLGSDCPFFILNKPCVATGRGEILQPIDLDLGHYRLVLVLSKIHVNTKNAFGLVSPSIPKNSAASIVTRPVSEWKENLYNDFEGPVFALHPLLAEIKQALYDAGALYSAMSGSGSTMFALVEPQKFEAFSSAINAHRIRQHVSIHST